MCFSSSASFASGIILTGIGIASVKKTRDSSQVPFAMIPLLFAAQQISEGFLWLSLSSSHNNIAQQICTCIFLFFAQVLWPFWVPFSIFRLEENKSRKKILAALLVTGVIISLYLAFCLALFDVSAHVEGRHISYRQDYPKEWRVYGGILYLLATIGPPFVSGIKKMWLLGIAILISYIITLIFYKEYVISVWCFFAAVISIVVLFILPTGKKNT